MIRTYATALQSNRKRMEKASLCMQQNCLLFRITFWLQTNQQCLQHTFSRCDIFIYIDNQAVFSDLWDIVFEYIGSLQMFTMNPLHASSHSKNSRNSTNHCLLQNNRGITKQNNVYSLEKPRYSSYGLCFDYSHSAKKSKFSKFSKLSKVSNISKVLKDCKPFQKARKQANTKKPHQRWVRRQRIIKYHDREENTVFRKPRKDDESIEHEEYVKYDCPNDMQPCGYLSSDRDYYEDYYDRDFYEDYYDRDCWLVLQDH